ncbi:hypothetical protein VTN96DRAFT_5745 [Rasamsonia emersonii]
MHWRQYRDSQRFNLTPAEPALFPICNLIGSMLATPLRSSSWQSLPRRTLALLAQSIIILSNARRPESASAGRRIPLLAT